MLSLLTRAADRQPGARPVLLEGAALALAHERADVQERAVSLLEQYPDDAPRGALLGYVDVVSPTLRARVEALTGIESTPIARRRRCAGRTCPHGDCPHRAGRECRRVDRAVGVADGGARDGDDVERFLDGVSRLCGERPQGFERRVAGLVKQADQGSEWGWFTGIGLVQAVVLSWTTGRGMSARGLPDSILGFLGRRAIEVGVRAARRNPRPLLALPTHSGGAIDIEVLAEREQRAGRLLNRPDANDRLQAKLRTIRDATPLSYSRTAVLRDRWNQRTLSSS